MEVTYPDPALSDASAELPLVVSLYSTIEGRRAHIISEKARS